MAFDFQSDQFKSALGAALVREGLVTPDGVPTSLGISQTNIAKAQNAGDAARATAALLENETNSVDQAQGMKAQSLVDNGWLQYASPEVQQEAYARAGVTPENVQQVANGYTQHRQNLADIRAMDGGQAIGALAELQASSAPPAAQSTPIQSATVMQAGGPQNTSAAGNGIGNALVEAGYLNPDGTQTQMGSDYLAANANPTASGQPYGLSGAESAVNTGLQSALQSLDQGIGTAQDKMAFGLSVANQGLSDAERRALRNSDRVFSQAQGALSPYQGAGQSASTQMADLQGLNGRQAQNAAMRSYQQSPGMQYALEESERAITRNAAATGGLGGGNVLRALQENAVGLAQQDYNNYFNQLASMSNQGMNANQIGAGLAGQQAGINAQLPMTSASQQAGNAMNAGMQNAANWMTGGMNSANLFGNAGNNIANMRYNTGVNMSNQTQGTAGALANLINGQGADIANIMGGGAANAANLQSGAGQWNADNLTQLATMLGNLATGNATANAGINNAIGQSQATASTAGIQNAWNSLNSLANLAGAAAGMPSMPSGTQAFNPYASQGTYNATFGNF